VRRENDLVRVGQLMLDRRRALKLFGAAGVAGVSAPMLAACTSSSTTTRSTQTLRVGLIVPQSGPMQEIGFEMANGFALYVKAAGGQIGGMNVDATTIDEGPTTKTGVTAVQTALSSKSYDVLVGIANSDVVAAVAGAVTTARTPLIGTLGSPMDMQASAFVWRTAFVAGEASKALATYLIGVPGGDSLHGELLQPRQIVIYHDTSSDAVAEAKAFADTLGGSAITMYTVTGPPNSPGVMAEIKAYNTTLVYAAVSGPSADDFVATYRKAIIKAAICGPGSLTEQSVLTGGTSGIFTSMNYAPDLNNDANSAFTSAYFAAFNKIPTTYSMTSYDAGVVLDAALRNVTEEVTGQVINTALSANLSFDSPRGRWQFNEARTPLQQWYLRQVRLDGTVLDNVVLADLEALT
jgi:branched-chain amino acid transport system substrate-binding protein